MDAALDAFASKRVVPAPVDLDSETAVTPVRHGLSAHSRKLRGLV